MNEVKIHGIYKHYKGDYYIVEDIGYDCERTDSNGSPLKLVIYRALYGASTIWVREYNDFMKEVNKNGQKFRFELQDISSTRSNLE